MNELVARLLARLRNWVDPRYVRRRLAHNFWLKVSSAVFAIGLWAFVNLGATEAERTLFVPLDWRGLPDDLTINSALPESATVHVRGPRTILGSIDEHREKVRIDLGLVRPGMTTVKIEPELLTLPRGIRVTGLSPTEVTLDVERIVTRSLRIIPNLAGVAPSGFRLADSEVRPAAVDVTGPASEVESLKEIPTEPLRTVAGEGVFEQMVALERPAERVRMVPERVIVRGRLEEIVASTEYRAVEVGVRNARGPAQLKPATADVVVRGPQRLLHEFKPSAENVWVDAGGLVRGSRPQKIQVSLPDGLAASEVRPSQVVLTVMAETPSRRTR